MKQYPSEKLMNIKKELEETGEYKGFTYIGIRVQEDEFSLGELDHNSRVWVDGEITEEELCGVCALDIRKFDETVKNCYFGDHMALIASDSAMMGGDDYEIIIENAEVIEVL